jgi:ribonuclease Z
LQEGNDYLNKNGQIIKNEWVTIPAPAGKSYAYSADTIYDEGLVEYVAGVNVLYHEATYLHDQSERAKERYHTTALEAGRLASLAKPGRLLLGHFSSKYEHLQPFTEEAKQHFDPGELALEGATYLV